MLRIILSFLLLLMLTVTGCSQGESQKHAWSKGHSQSQQLKETHFGQVVHVADGDTITIKTDAGKMKIRLFAIDAPEKSQPYGPQSTGILKALIGGSYVQARVMATDRYGRKVATVFCDKQDINAEMLRLGAAWHFKKYHHPSSPLYERYDDIERSARNNRKGLWNRDNPTPPWEYRKALREQKAKK